MSRQTKIPREVDRKTICEFLQLSSGRIHQLAQLGFPKSGFDRYPFKECVQWTVDHYRQAAPKRREGGSTEEARKILYQENAEKYRLENQVRRGELIEFEDVRQFLLLLGNTLASQLEGLPARLSHNAEQREKLLDECRTIRAELASAVENCTLIEDPIPDADPAADSQRSRVGGATSGDASGDTDSRAVA